MPPQHKPPGLLWFMGGTSPPQITQRERETWQPRSSAHSRTQVIITQTFWASPRAVHRRPRALFAFRCSSAHVPALHRAPGQSPLCAVWAIFFFFFPPFLPFLPQKCGVSSLPPAWLASPRWRVVPEGEGSPRSQLLGALETRLRTGGWGDRREVPAAPLSRYKGSACFVRVHSIPRRGAQRPAKGDARACAQRPPAGRPAPPRLPEGRDSKVFPVGS